MVWVLVSDELTCLITTFTFSLPYLEWPDCLLTLTFHGDWSPLVNRLPLNHFTTQSVYLCSTLNSYPIFLYFAAFQKSKNQYHFHIGAFFRRYYTDVKALLHTSTVKISSSDCTKGDYSKSHQSTVNLHRWHRWVLALWLPEHDPTNGIKWIVKCLLAFSVCVLSVHTVSFKW